MGLKKTRIFIEAEDNISITESYGNDFYGTTYNIQAGDSMILYIEEGLDLLITERDKNGFCGVSKEV